MQWNYFLFCISLLLVWHMYIIFHVYNYIHCYLSYMYFFLEHVAFSCCFSDLENVVKRSEFVSTRESCSTKVICYYYYHCMCDPCFVTQPLGQPHTIFRVFPFSGKWMLSYEELIMAEGSPPSLITMQHTATFELFQGFPCLKTRSLAVCLTTSRVFRRGKN